jgi:hypothetical protein
MEREFFIKWAAQDALYEAVGWIKHNPEPPAENALSAFAGVFEGEGFDDRSGFQRLFRWPMKGYHNHRLTQRAPDWWDSPRFWMFSRLKPGSGKAA